jgi:membrane protease subunit HflK
MERNIQKIGLVNLLVLLLAGAASILLGRYSSIYSGQIAAVFFGIGFLQAAVSFFQMRLEEKERLEQLEFDEINRDKNAASIFTSEAETFPAKRSREQFERYFNPAFTIVIFLLEAAGTWFLWTWLNSALLVNPKQPMVALSLFGVMALVLFLLGKYSGSLARLQKERLLRPAASFLVLGAYVSAAVAIAIGCALGQVYKADIFLGRGLIVVLALAAVESLLNLVLEIYRPRGKGKLDHVVYESRVFGLLSQPEGILTTAARTLDYQFGFKVSETWFYRFLEKALAWLILLQFIVLVGSSCFVFISPGEQALIERFGSPLAGNNLFNPGLHLKLPWPIDKVYRFRTDEVQRFTIGEVSEKEETAKKEEEPKVIVWTVAHEKEPLNLMVASRDPNAKTNAPAGPQSGLPVDLLTVGIPVQFQIKDVRAWAYNHIDSAKLLERIATREVIRYLMAVDLFEILSNGRAKASTELLQLIQKEADSLKMGVKILFVGLEDIHPPVKVAPHYEKVIAAQQENEAKLREAEGYKAKTLALAEAEAQKQLLEADMFRIERTTSAAAQGEQFKNRVAAYQAAPDVYLQRAYLQALTKNMTNSRLYVMTTTNSNETIQIDLQDKINPSISDITIPSAKK